MKWNRRDKEIWFGAMLFHQLVIFSITILSTSYHVRYLSHLAVQVGSSNWGHKTRIHSIQRCRHFGAKSSRSAFLLEKQLHPFQYWIKYSWSGLAHILYYINLSIRWNTVLRKLISLCQHVFYYTVNKMSSKYPYLVENY
jgi:hypothetical protein